MRRRPRTLQAQSVYSLEPDSGVWKWALALLVIGLLTVAAALYLSRDTPETQLKITDRITLSK